MKINSFLLGFAGLNRNHFYDLIELLQSEVYCIYSMLLVKLGYIIVPDGLDPAYRSNEHNLEGAINRLRWLTPDRINSLGSDPATTLKMR